MPRPCFPAFALLVWASSSCVADDRPPSPRKQPPTNAVQPDNAIQDLTRDLLDGLDRPGIKRAGQPPVSQRPGSQRDESQRDGDAAMRERQLGEGEDLGEELDPLHDLGRRMKTVRGLLEGQNTSDKTQRMQREIVQDIDRLIEQARKQCACRKPSAGSSSLAKNSPPSGKGTPDKPSARPDETASSRSPAGQSAVGQPQVSQSRPATEPTDPADAQRADGAGDELTRMLKDVWGHLPARVREQMQNASREQSLSKYDRLIEQYYRRLAEQ